MGTKCSEWCVLITLLQKQYLIFYRWTRPRSGRAKECYQTQPKPSSRWNRCVRVRLLVLLLIFDMRLSLNFSIAAGQNTTLLLARPNEKFSDLPRHPIDVQPPAFCVVCSKDTGDEDSPLQCDKVIYTSSACIRSPRKLNILMTEVRFPIPSGMPWTCFGLCPWRRMVLYRVWKPSWWSSRGACFEKEQIQIEGQGEVRG